MILWKKLEGNRYQTYVPGRRRPLNWGQIKKFAPGISLMQGGCSADI
jgi:hypothetical protein